MLVRLAAALILAAFLTPLSLTAQGTTFTGTVLDPLGARIPGVSVTVTNTQTQRAVETQTNASGTFAVAVTTGAYLVQASRPGFRTLQQRVDVGVSRSQTFTLRVGELEETLHVVGSRGEPAAAPRVTDLTDGARQNFQRVLAACGQAAAGDVPRGGTIRPPRKIRSVAPWYPQDALDAGIGG